jgi:hypothetical protein
LISIETRLNQRVTEAAGVDGVAVAVCDLLHTFIWELQGDELACAARRSARWRRYSRTMFNRSRLDNQTAWRASGEAGQDRETQVDKREAPESVERRPLVR